MSVDYLKAPKGSESSLNELLSEKVLYSVQGLNSDGEWKDVMLAQHFEPEAALNRVANFKETLKSEWWKEHLSYSEFRIVKRTTTDVLYG